MRREAMFCAGKAWAGEQHAEKEKRRISMHTNQPVTTRVLRQREAKFSDGALGGRTPEIQRQVGAASRNARLKTQSPSGSRRVTQDADLCV